MKTEVTYKGVTIKNLRTARTTSTKIMGRDIQIRFVADRFAKDGDSSFGANSLDRAHAMIDWLLANGSIVEDGRIVTTMSDLDDCLFGSEPYTKFMEVK